MRFSLKNHISSDADIGENTEKKQLDMKRKVCKISEISADFPAPMRSPGENENEEVSGKKRKRSSLREKRKKKTLRKNRTRQDFISFGGIGKGKSRWGEIASR